MNRIDHLNLYLLGTTTFNVSFIIILVNLGIAFKAYLEDEDIMPAMQKAYIGIILFIVSSITFT